jgi:hypothetical protein
MPEKDRYENLCKFYCRIGRRKGRHILGMTPMLQYTMPMENVRAIFDTAREIQAGEHNG